MMTEVVDVRGDGLRIGMPAAGRLPGRRRDRRPRVPPGGAGAFPLIAAGASVANRPNRPNHPIAAPVTARAVRSAILLRPAVAQPYVLPPRRRPGRTRPPRGPSTYASRSARASPARACARSHAASRGLRQLLARGEDFALPPGQRRGQRAGRAGVQIGLALRRTGRGDPAPDPDLAALRGPVEAERRLGVGGQLAPLRAGGVRGEVPAPLVRVVQHQRPYVRAPLVVHRGQGHGVRLGLAGRHGLAEPPVEQRQRAPRARRRVEGRKGDVPDPLRVAGARGRSPAGRCPWRFISSTLAVVSLAERGSERKDRG